MSGLRGRSLTKTGSDFTRSFLSGFLLTSETQPIDCYLLINGSTWNQIEKSNEEYFVDLRHLLEEREQDISRIPQVTPSKDKIQTSLNRLIDSGEDILYWSRTMRRYLPVS